MIVGALAIISSNHPEAGSLIHLISAPQQLRPWKRLTKIYAVAFRPAGVAVVA